jgi:hypothetical protein
VLKSFRFCDAAGHRPTRPDLPNRGGVKTPQEEAGGAVEVAHSYRARIAGWSRAIPALGGGPTQLEGHADGRDLHIGN